MNRQADLHRTFLDLIFEPGGDALFGADPAAFGAARGLGAPDQAALVRYRKRLRVYRGLVKGSILDPLPDCFPILRALLEPRDLWEPLLDAFFASRSVQSLYYRDVNPTFLAWLVETGPHHDRWPFLLQLAHYEYMELEILRWPEDAPLDARPERAEPTSRLVASGALRNLAYGYRVHEADEDDPEPEEGPAHLCCYRDRQSRFVCLEVDGPRSAFLARALEGEPLGEAAEAVGLAFREAAAWLEGLRRDGAVLGYR